MSAHPTSSRPPVALIPRRYVGSNAWQIASASERAGETLEGLVSTRGFLAAAIVDSASGFTLGSVQSDEAFDIECAAALNTVVVQSKLSALERMGLGDEIDDILITLGKQYHLIRLVPGDPEIFVYAALDRETANLAMARERIDTAARSILG